jgi:hypothetical protein
MSEKESLPPHELPIDEMVTVFLGDLSTCRERLRVLEEEGIPAVIVGSLEGEIPDVGAPILQLRVMREDIPDVVDVFQEIWKEILNLEGVEDPVEALVDLSQDTVICPGCQSEISEVTEDGECPVCGLFLGFPPEEEEEGEAASS